MAATQTPQTDNGSQAPSFETVWAALQETDRILKETAKRQEETAKRQEETVKWQEEAAKRQEETVKWQEEAAKRREENAKWHEEAAKRHEEIERIVKNNAQLIGKLGGRFGEMVEYMVVPNLEDKFREFGFVFNKTHQQTYIKDYKNNIITEVDITLENGDKVMIIEVKSKPTTEDISRHVERMEKLRAHADLHNDKRILVGAVAGMVFGDFEKTFALKNGFYVIEPSGETFNITPPQGNPKEW